MKFFVHFLVGLKKLEKKNGVSLRLSTRIPDKKLLTKTCYRKKFKITNDRFALISYNKTLVEKQLCLPFLPSVCVFYFECLNWLQFPLTLHFFRNFGQNSRNFRDVSEKLQRRYERFARWYLITKNCIFADNVQNSYSIRFFSAKNNLLKIQSNI